MAYLKSKSIIILGIVAFLAMSFLSLYSMPVDINGKMERCPFMDGLTSFCQMSINEHISLWQEFFTFLKQNNLLLSLFSLLVILYTITIALVASAYKKLGNERLRNYLYRYKPEIKFFDYLVMLFSKGIIYAKIYA